MKPFYIDLFAGSQGITKAFRRRGLRCYPLDLNQGLKGDLLNRGVYRRILKLIRSGSCRGIFAAPPCTTYSSARHPALRTRRRFRGLQGIVGDAARQVHTANMLMDRMCALVGRRCSSHHLGRGEPAELHHVARSRFEVDRAVV